MADEKHVYSKAVLLKSLKRTSSSVDPNKHFSLASAFSTSIQKFSIGNSAPARQTALRIHIQFHLKLPFLVSPQWSRSKSKFTSKSAVSCPVKERLSVKNTQQIAGLVEHYVNLSLIRGVETVILHLHGNVVQHFMQ